jgi:hypothetical protein
MGFCGGFLIESIDGPSTEGSSPGKDSPNEE